MLTLGLEKSGLTEVIEPLYFYQHLSIFRLAILKALPSLNRKQLLDTIQ